jgi:hypothetical protein
VPGLDDRIADLTPGHRERLRQATREALTELRRRLDVERDPFVAQDLRILVRSGSSPRRNVARTRGWEIGATSPARCRNRSEDAAVPRRRAREALPEVQSRRRAGAARCIQDADGGVRAFPARGGAATGHSRFPAAAALYAFALERVGVDIPPERLASIAHQSFEASVLGPAV